MKLSGDYDFARCQRAPWDTDLDRYEAERIKPHRVSPPVTTTVEEHKRPFPPPDTDSKP